MTLPGIILVHDLTNRKSQVNLQKWLSEILNQDSTNAVPHVDVDPEQFLGSTQVSRNLSHKTTPLISWSQERMSLWPGFNKKNRNPSFKLG